MLSLTVYIYPSSVYLAYYICLYTIRTVRSMLFLLLVFYFICRAPMPSRAVPVRSCLLIPMVHQFDPRSTLPPFFVSFSTVPPVGRWLCSLSFSFFDPSSFTFTFDFVSSISRLSLSVLIDCLLCTVLSTNSSVRPSAKRTLLDVLIYPYIPASHFLLLAYLSSIFFLSSISYNIYCVRFAP